MNPPRRDEPSERERATAAILSRSDEMARQFEQTLRESEELLERLRAGKDDR